MIEIEKQEVYPGIISLRFKNQYETCATFMRMQEFYESPFKEIRGKVFTLEQYMDCYAEACGNFSYTLDWGGFNVPGHIVKRFFEYFTVAQYTFLEKERTLRKILLVELIKDDKFYLIGHYEKDNSSLKSGYGVLAHEVAHGLFYLNQKYRRTALGLVRNLPPKAIDKMTKKLLSGGGYSKAVIKDEIQAYLATSDAPDLEANFGTGLWTHGKRFRSLFKETMKSNYLSE